MRVSHALMTARSDLAAIPSVTPNRSGGRGALTVDGRTSPTADSVTERVICQVVKSTVADLPLAVDIAKETQPSWAAKAVVKRGDILRQIALLMREHRTAMAQQVEDLRRPLVFLASRAPSCVTGHELRVDGGFAAW